MVGDGLVLFGREPRERVGEVEVAVVGGRCGRGVGEFGGQYRAARRGAGDVDGLAVGNRDQPRLDVVSGGQVWVGLHRGQECLRPRIVSVYRPEDGPADAQHGCPMRGDDGLEWLLVCHTL